MNQKLIIQVLFGLLSIQAMGQGFEKSYLINSTLQYQPDEIALENTGDGGFLIAVGTYLWTINVNTNVTLLRVDANGDTVWTKIIGTPELDYISSIVRTADGNFLLTGINGNTQSEGQSVILLWLIKMNIAGEVIWEKHIDPGWTEGYTEKIFEVGGGDIIITGRSVFSWENTAFMMKLDKDGNLKWMEQFKGFDEPAFGVCKSGGDFFMGGATYGASGGDNYHLLKVDSNGNKVWEKSYTIHPLSIVFCSSLSPSENGGVFFVATDLDEETGDDQGVVLKINSNGLLQKKKLYSICDFCSSLPTWDGGVVTTGWPSKIWRMDGNGDSLFTVPVGNLIEPHFLQSLLRTDDGQLLVAGVTEPPGLDLYLLKIGDLDVVSNTMEEKVFEEAIAYPNPTNGLITLNIDWGGQAEVTLSDIGGRVVLEKEISLSAGNILDISDTLPGIYFMKILTSRSAYSGKIIRVEP